MSDRVQTLLEGRRKRLERTLGKDLPPPTPVDLPRLPARDREHLIRAAEDLYWNELEWENITEEERVGEVSLAEMTFPAFLSFVDGLLVDEALPDASFPAVPRPEVVEEVLGFLASRLIALDDGDTDGDDPERTEWERTVTSRLLDLVLFRYYDLRVKEVELVERIRGPE